jgi:hypothetical protein
VGLSIEGSRRLLELYKQIPERFASQADAPLSPLEKLHLLLIRLSEHWPTYRILDWQQDVPRTNNGTERVIGRTKMRSCTVQGYKSEPTMLAGLMVAGAWVFQWKMFSDSWVASPVACKFHPPILGRHQ